MFTGIIESLGKVEHIIHEHTNTHFILSCSFTQELKIDQSLAHNGVCLTVVELFKDNTYKVTAIKETLDKTTLQFLKEGDFINLERCMPANGRFDGHIVQGHVDQTGICISKKDLNGSWEFEFDYNASIGNVTVEKGSITINGVSLTVVKSTSTSFSVCIIPYTYEHTTFKKIVVGSLVNLEFDIVGKYVTRLLQK